MLSILYYLSVTILTLAFLVPVTLLFVVSYPFDRERYLLHVASRMWAQALFRINPFWKITLQGLENIEKGRPYVVLVNHSSMGDIPMMYMLPLSFKWVSKKEVERIPVFGWVMMMHGDIAIVRGANNSLRQLISKGKQRLCRGTSVIIFPEGTRSRSGELGRFKEGAFVLAKEANVAILPCLIEGTRTMTKGWRMVIPHNFVIRVMPAVQSDYIAQRTPRELATELHETMKKEKNNI